MYHPFTNLPSVKLEADKRRAARDIKRLENQLQLEIDPDVDEADPGLTDQAVTRALLENARNKAEAIDRALEQAKSGQYGVCEDCQQAIDPERLAIFPQTTVCVSCKSKQEGGLTTLSLFRRNQSKAA